MKYYRCGQHEWGASQSKVNRARTVAMLKDDTEVMEEEVELLL
jgi:hypothetical protein